MAYFIIGGVGLVVAAIVVACLYEWWMGDDGYEDVRVVREAPEMVAEEESWHPLEALLAGDAGELEASLDDQWWAELHAINDDRHAEEHERRPGEWTQEWSLMSMAVFADVQAFMSGQDADAARFIAGLEEWRRRETAVAA